MMSPMASCVVISWPLKEQQVKCLSNVFTLTHKKIRCRRLNQIEMKNVKMKVECVMWNEQIDGLTTNHSFAPLPKQEWMQILDPKEMESSSKIDIRDVSWWMSIKYLCNLVVSISAKLSKKRCNSLATGGKPSCVACKHDWSRCGPPLSLRNIFLQYESIKNMKPSTQIQNHQNPTP
jgi:hypothetical protein